MQVQKQVDGMLAKEISEILASTKMDLRPGRQDKIRGGFMTDFRSNKKITLLLLTFSIILIFSPLLIMNIKSPSEILFMALGVRSISPFMNWIVRAGVVLIVAAIFLCIKTFVPKSKLALMSFLFGCLCIIILLSSSFLTATVMTPLSHIQWDNPGKMTATEKQGMLSSLWTFWQVPIWNS